MVNRRNFLKSSAAVVIGGLAANQLISSCATKPAAPKKQVGLQLYSLRDAMKDDVTGTLKKVAEMGYTTVEPFVTTMVRFITWLPPNSRKSLKTLG